MRLIRPFMIAIVLVILSISAYAQAPPDSHTAIAIVPVATATNVALPAVRGQQLAQLDAQINAAIDEYKTKRLLIAQRAALEAKLTAEQLDAMDGPFPTSEGSLSYEWRPRPPAKSAEAKQPAAGKGSPN